MNSPRQPQVPPMPQPPQSNPLNPSQQDILMAQIDAHKAALNESNVAGINLRTNLVLIQKQFQILSAQAATDKKSIEDLTAKLQEAENKLNTLIEEGNKNATQQVS